jgi:energy-converting hydrogenase Eha subunit B
VKTLEVSHDAVPVVGRIAVAVEVWRTSYLGIHARSDSFYQQAITLVAILGVITIREATEVVEPVYNVVGGVTVICTVIGIDHSLEAAVDRRVEPGHEEYREARRILLI